MYHFKCKFHHSLIMVINVNVTPSATDRRLFAVSVDPCSWTKYFRRQFANFHSTKLLFDSWIEKSIESSKPLTAEKSPMLN